MWHSEKGTKTYYNTYASHIWFLAYLDQFSALETFVKAFLCPNVETSDDIKTHKSFDTQEKVHISFIRSS